MTYFIYRYVMRLVAFVAGYAGGLNNKLRRRNEGLRNQTIPLFDSCIWIHCASLGEFEQGKMLVDGLRNQYPDKKLVLTFFSASGYEKIKGYKKVDKVLYLPYDTPGRMASMVDSLRPELVVFIKYEFWYSLLNELVKRKISFVFVSAVFRREQYFFKRGFRSLRGRILKATHIFVQNQMSKELLAEFGYYAVTVAGDTRIDRVIALKNQDYSWDSLEKWKDNTLCVVAGSTWPDDERELIPATRSFPRWKWIIAPHEITKDHLDMLRGLLGKQAVFLSELTSVDDPIPQEKKVLVIDRIGLLSVLYRYGDIAYVGGGMSSGIHNTLEPSVYGLPLVFGPKYEKFQEAVDFYQRGAARVVHNTNGMIAAFNYYDDSDRRYGIKLILQDYFDEHSGATEKIINLLNHIIPTE